MRDTHSVNDTVQAIVPAVKSATAAGATIDTRGFASLLFAIETGAIVGAGNVTAKLQESDTTTDVDFTDVAAANQIGTLPGALAADSSYRVGYRGSKRYARLYLTKNSGTSIAVGASAILGHPAFAPVP
ncbi:MAG: hypothetical protein JWQ89_3118 [Devosia sp.]|uniref:hypothetical protein n=1 Tax=Devosia sp. TaxID=1871048 RepID=UPI00261B9EEE|nr:hypothetical protein [Devosia sp.]MDB5541391.1 hypothetical protein [Devosia sp.]